MTYIVIIIKHQALWYVLRTRRYIRQDSVPRKHRTILLTRFNSEWKRLRKFIDLPMLSVDMWQDRAQTQLKSCPSNSHIPYTVLSDNAILLHSLPKWPYPRLWLLLLSSFYDFYSKMLLGFQVWGIRRRRVLKFIYIYIEREREGGRGRKDRETENLSFTRHQTRDAFTW